MLRTSPVAKDELITSFAVACGCPANTTLDSTISCLRSVPVLTLVNASAEAWQASGVSLGGNLVKENTFWRIRSSDYPKLPIVVSTCRDESTSAAIGFNASSDEITSLPIQDLAQGASLPPSDVQNFVADMLTEYPNDPSQGCPFDGKNTTYDQPSQYKRMAAILTDGTYTEAWTEYLQSFSSKTNTWGMLFETPIPGSQEALGVQHASDLVYHFPELLGADRDPRAQVKTRKVVDLLHSMLVNFVSNQDPNGLHGDEAKEEYCFRWPLFEEQKQVMSLSAEKGAVAVDLPQKDGFGVLKTALRPDGF